MSFARDARDTASSLFYLRALDSLREAHLGMSVNGEDVPADFWEKGEAEALRLMKREFFCLEARRVFFPPEKAEILTDEKDYEARSTALVEMGMYETHRTLVQIPWVGDPDFSDPK